MFKDAVNGKSRFGCLEESDVALFPFRNQNFRNDKSDHVHSEFELFVWFIWVAK
jgi:hypothetical protein